MSDEKPVRMGTYHAVPKKTRIPTKIRPVTEGDVPFIFNSWLRSFKKGLMPMYVQSKLYYAEQHRLCKRLLMRSTTLMACDPNDPANIYGYICYERINDVLVVHYAYTKHTFRSMGVLRTLTENIEQDWSTMGIFTHSTEFGSHMAKKYNLVYHPYVLINYLGDAVHQPEPQVAETVQQHEIEQQES